MGLFSTATIDIKSMIKKDGKQHILQFALKDNGKPSSSAVANIDIYAMKEIDKILASIEEVGAEILDMRCVGLGQAIKYIIRYK